MMHSPRNTYAGVTLMELLVVMVVLGILASIAVPSYRNHVLRANRAEAKSALLSMAGDLERCFTRNSAYTDAPPTAPCDAASSVPYTVPSGNYQITGVINASTFSLSAVPRAGQTADAQCGTFTLDQRNDRDVSGTLSAQSCWGR